LYGGLKTAGFNAKAAAGIIDRSAGTKTDTSDTFIWGSVTKVLTGTGVLRLVDQGTIKLGDTIPQHIDPFIKKMKLKNPKLNFTSLQDLFGPNVSQITVEDLLGMKSGVPDYDTATPSKHPTDEFRAIAYANPTKSFAPEDMLNEPYVHTGKLDFPPGVCDKKKYYNCYSSTNFVLLGLLLANHAGVETWEDYKQSDIIKTVYSDFHNLKYALTGAPKEYSRVRGYDTTHYNGQTTPVDVYNVAGVFAGWTASDFVADATDISRFVYDVYRGYGGQSSGLVSEKYVNMMYDTSGFTGYGLATFNLTRRTGQHGPDGVAMGHLGATYGYQSVVAYNPAMDFSIAIATNIERDEQDQPADAMCLIYNAVRAIVRGIPAQKCTFTTGYFSGGCKCV
jgi:CubicO group peptidase (beta-lactamase class C family)